MWCTYCQKMSCSRGAACQAVTGQDSLILKAIHDNLAQCRIILISTILLIRFVFAKQCSFSLPYKVYIINSYDTKM